MAEKSGGGAAPQTGVTVWQCVHCNVEIPGIAVGYVMKKCPICGEAQITCINPDCKAPFEKPMEVCEKCQTLQQLPPQDQSSMEVQILCINPNCKAPLESENSETCKKCDTPQRERRPPSAQPPTTCSNPDCGEPLDDQGESELCSKCSALQKQAQQSMDTEMATQPRVCVNQKCREPLPNKEDNVCSKCEAPQTLCINPKCKQPLFTLDQEMCHECHVSQKPDQQIINSSVSGKTTGGGADKTADGAPQPSSTPMETTPAAPQKLISGESSVDKTNPATATKSNTVSPAKESPSSKVKEKNASQGSKAATTAVGSEKSGKPPPTDSTLTPTKKSHSNASSRQSSKSSMTSDSEESSDSEEFTTPPPSVTKMTTDHTDPKEDDKGTPSRGGGASVAVSQLQLTRLTLNDPNTGSRKHNRGDDDAEGSTSSKRRALQDDEEPQLSPKPVSSVESAKVKKPETEKKSADAHKGIDQKQKDDEGSGAQGKGGAGSTPEVHVCTL